MVVLVLLVAAAAGAAADAVQGAPLPRVGRVQQLPARQPYLEPHVRSTPFASACTAWYRRERESPSASVCLLPQLESSGCLGAEAAACAGRGMGNNPEFRVEIHPTTLTTGFGLRFIHPTIAGPIKNEVPPTPTKQPQLPFTRRHVSFDHRRQIQFGADPSGRCGDVDRRAS